MRFYFKVGSINSFRGVFEFISRKLPSERRKLSGHCDRLTFSKLSKQIKSAEKFINPRFAVFSINGEFIELTLSGPQN